MTSRCITKGQVETGIVIHNGREFAALGASVAGRHVTGYTHKDKQGQITLRSWCGKTKLRVPFVGV